MRYMLPLHIALGVVFALLGAFRQLRTNSATISIRRVVIGSCVGVMEGGLEILFLIFKKCQ